MTGAFLVEGFAQRVFRRVDDKQHAIGACHFNFGAADAFLLDDIATLTEARCIQHVQRHAIDIDPLAHDVAGRTGNRSNDGGLVAGEFVQQARLAGVGTAGNDHGHSFAEQATLASALLNAVEVLANGLEPLGQLLVGEEVDFLFGEVYCRFDVSAQVNHRVGETADHRGELTLQGAHGRAHGGAGAGFYEVCDGFCLRQVDLVVEEGSLGEFTGLGSAAADLNNSIDERFHDERATVTL